MNKQGFTLSEILITLGVIGVVAAITLPTVIKNYQKAQTVNRLKETYSLLSQAFTRAISDHDTPKNWDYGNNNTDFFVENYLAPYIKIINKSTSAPEHYTISGGKLTDIAYENRPHYYLANGVELTLSPYVSDVNVIFIFADLNGKKLPNRLGKDCFFFQINKNSNNLSSSKFLVFHGISQSISLIESDCKSRGAVCGAWIMREGWKMPNNYPW